jgi:nucleotide-binding universal stress UspA family protein
MAISKELIMEHHILVPLDGSVLAECVLPHVVAIARALKSCLTLLRVIEPASGNKQFRVLDPLEWQINKAEAVTYLDEKMAQLSAIVPKVETLLVEGLPAEKIIETANETRCDLIALSSHGKSGLSEWNISSVVQKIILRSKKSIFLVRAYRPPQGNIDNFKYRCLAAPLDCSMRAECILPIAAELAVFFHAQLLLANVVRKPEINCRIPPTEEDITLINRLMERNQEEGKHYFDQLRSRLSIQGVDPETYVSIHSDIAYTLHDFVDKNQVDLVVLSAHGHSGSLKWPYGSVTTSFIVYGSTPLLIIQDLTPEEIQQTQAEIIASEYKGH